MYIGDTEMSIAISMATNNIMRLLLVVASISFSLALFTIIPQLENKRNYWIAGIIATIILVLSLYYGCIQFTEMETFNQYANATVVS